MRRSKRVNYIVIHSLRITNLGVIDEICSKCLKTAPHISIHDMVDIGCSHSENDGFYLGKSIFVKVNLAITFSKLIMASIIKRHRQNIPMIRYIDILVVSTF